jgi:hypothetical protein
MSRTAGSTRHLLLGLAFAALLSGCQTVPGPQASLPPTSSLLAVDVLFPLPLSRDPSLVQAFFLKGPIPDAADEFPELIPATFVKRSRAYLLDPEPGAYSVVAVTAEYAPPWNRNPIDGVTNTVWSGTSSDAMIFPAELIRRTTTLVAPGNVVFMGVLRVRRGDHINANALPQDDLQKWIAERLRPGVTTESGLRGWLKRTRMIELERTSLDDQPADRRAFFAAARADLGDSPWAGVLPRDATPAETPVARPRTPVPRFEPRVKSPAKSAVKQDADRPARSPVPIPEPAVAPEPHRFPGVPPDSMLAKIELGMRHDQVETILGSPDERIDRLTAKAWIPFYNGPDANLRDWIYEGKGRVVFSLYKGALEVIDVIYDPDQGK